MKRMEMLYIRKMLLGMIVLLLGAVPVAAQTTVDVKIDSLELWVGQQTAVTLDVSVDAKSRLELPAIKPGDTLTAGVEVLEIARPDTQRLNDGARLMISQKYIITSFDSALYYLPPFVVKVDGKPYSSKNLALNVLAVPVDTVHIDHFDGPKEIMDLPFSWKEDWQEIFLWSLLLLVCMLLALYLFMRYKDNKPLIRVVKSEPKLPPHQVAMHEIDMIKQEKTWAQEDSKEYYTRLTATLRTYIQERYGFNAMEMTSSEIIERLMKLQDEEALNELRLLFTTADLVKFAKYSTQVNENDRNLVNAIEFINQTKLEEDPTAKPVKEEITIEEKRSRRSMWLLRGAICLTVLATAGLLGYIVWMVYKVMY